MTEKGYNLFRNIQTVEKFHHFAYLFLRINVTLNFGIFFVQVFKKQDHGIKASPSLVTVITRKAEIGRAHV